MYKDSNTIIKTILWVTAAVIIAIGLQIAAFASHWFGTCIGNRVDYELQKTDDVTNYDTIKSVEDTCRAMISSYESDKLTYEQYKDSDDKDEKSWAQQAKMRANRTVSTYNNYMLKNSFVWSDNIPDDIVEKLDVIE